MSALFFACEWVIRPAVNYVRLVGLAREMGCELAIAQANIVTPQQTRADSLRAGNPGQRHIFRICCPGWRIT